MNETPTAEQLSSLTSTTEDVTQHATIVTLESDLADSSMSGALASINHAAGSRHKPNSKYHGVHDRRMEKQKHLRDWAQTVDLKNDVVLSPDESTILTIKGSQSKEGGEPSYNHAN